MISTRETTTERTVSARCEEAVQPFRLYRDHIRPVIEARRRELESMYAPVMGRPEIDPVLLLGLTLLQALERLSDRRALERALFDTRWRMALDISDGWIGIDPSSLSYFRARLSRHGGAKLVFEAGLEAMRAAGYLGNRRAGRIDSTHVLAELAALSRLECVRETLRLALAFLLRTDPPPAPRPCAPPGAVHNPHDPQAQWSTKRSLGKAGWVGYKVQVCETAAEEACARREPTQAVVTAVVTQPATSSDHGSLEVVLAAQARREDPAPETVFADAGYVSAPALERADANDYELCGPVGAPPHSSRRFGSDAFDVDLTNRRVTCPAGKISAQCSRITETGRDHAYFYFAWAGSDCVACPLAPQCLSRKKPQPFRTLQVGEKHMLVQARRRLCRTPDYRARRRRRSGIEGTISELKRGYGIRRCRYRGLAKTDVQMQFAGAACNLRRWAARLCWIARTTPNPNS